jgi:hypothetical protein
MILIIKTQRSVLSEPNAGSTGAQQFGVALHETDRERLAGLVFGRAVDG